MNDHADVIEFIDVLNNTPANEFETTIAQVFDVDLFLRYTAATIVLSSLDTYFGRIANFYLYHRPTDGRFVFLPWDLNETFGGFPCGGPGGDLTQFDPYNPWCDSQARPLITRILEVDTYKNTYLSYIDQLIGSDFTSTAIDADIATLKPLIESHVQSDPRALYDYQSFLTGIGHDPPGGGGPGGPGPHMGVPNLGFFVDGRCSYLNSVLP